MPTPRPAALVLLLLALPATPTAGADHIGGMDVRQTYAGPDHAVTLTVVYNTTGRCCSGLFEWTTDGARGVVHDGFTNGAYVGDGSGSGLMTDGRPFTWSRTRLASTFLFSIQVTYAYRAAGLHEVEWRDCCPEWSGSLDVLAV